MRCFIILFFSYALNLFRLSNIFIKMSFRNYSFRSIKYANKFCYCKKRSLIWKVKKSVTVLTKFFKSMKNCIYEISLLFAIDIGITINQLTGNQIFKIRELKKFTHQYCVAYG